MPVNDIAALEAAFSDRTAGIVLELIQGEGGINPLTPEFIAKARELADRHNALLVADETQCGVGRPGTYFAYQRSQHVILPDVMVTAKPLACGIPLGVIMANEKAAATIKPGMHGTTFGGGALACRVALEFCDILDELLPSIQRVGGYFHVELNELARKHACVKEVRGFGLMLGMELNMPGKQTRTRRHGGGTAHQLHARHGAPLPAAVHHYGKGSRPGGEDSGQDPGEGEMTRRLAIALLGLCRDWRSADRTPPRAPPAPGARPTNAPFSASSWDCSPCPTWLAIPKAFARTPPPSPRCSKSAASRPACSKSRARRRPSMARSRPPAPRAPSSSTRTTTASRSTPKSGRLRPGNRWCATAPWIRTAA